MGDWHFVYDGHQRIRRFGPEPVDPPEPDDIEDDHHVPDHMKVDFTEKKPPWDAMRIGLIADSGGQVMFDERPPIAEAFPEPIMCVYCDTQFNRSESHCIACGAPTGRSING